MGGPTPLSSFFGCLPISCGVVTAVILSVLRAALFLSLTSGRDSFRHFGMEIGSHTQLCAATVALAGAPLSVLAGFGVMFRMERYVRYFFQFLVCTTCTDVALLIVHPAFYGQICTGIAPDYILQSGRVFVCSFIAAGATFWISAFLALELYVAYSVWSQAELLLQGDHSDLFRFDKNNNGVLPSSRAGFGAPINSKTFGAFPAHGELRG